MNSYGQGRFPSIPFVIKNIIIINVIMVVIQYLLGLRGINLGDYLGLHYWGSPQFRWWQFFTHMFMHGDPFDVGLTIQHIFFNMFGLYMFGTVLENLWGPKRFLIFYLICGFGAALCYLGTLSIQFSIFHNAFLAYQQHPTFEEFAHFTRSHNMMIDPRFLTEWGADKSNPEYATETIKFLNARYTEMQNVPMVGASGAIFGVSFGFAYLFPNTELYIMFIPIPIKAKWAIAGYAAIELFSGVSAFKGDNVAHFAHLGGMLFAFILLRIWNKNNRKHFY